MKRQTALSGHVIQFARFLRQQNFNIGPDEEADVLKGLTLIDWSNHRQFKEVQRAAFCKHVDQYLTFDRHYEHYWSELAKAVDSKTKQVAEENVQPRKPVAPSIQVIKQWLHGHREQDIQDVHQASAASVAARPDLSMLSDHHQREWQEVIRLIQQYIAKQKTRRWVRSGNPVQLDLRKVLQKSITRGGEIAEVAFRQPKKNRAHVLLICDVSRSMEMYSHFLIQMMYALQNSSLRIHCFVFSTELVPVSHFLRRKSLSDALTAIGEEVQGWAGGTRIGESLTMFLEKHRNKALPKNTFTFVLSDGWDAGDIPTLSEAMRQLQKRSRKLIWINPLASSEAFDPQVLGMKAAMPYIDHLVPAVDASSLKRYLRSL